MKAVGVIVEYNPFHNGHAYHLQAAKESANAEIVIAVMSGNFLQRGEPALVSKWFRTKMALLNGVDIVIELPYPFATQKAETFASGAVSLLQAIGCKSLCFGSENGDISTFWETINFLDSHHDQYNELIKKNIKTGISYPKALSLAFQTLSNSENLVNLAMPNNILGYHYMKAMKQQESNMEAITVKRKNADYHDEHFSSETIASATSIRKALFESQEKKLSINQYVPIQTQHLLEEYLACYGGFHEWRNYWKFLQFRILQSAPEELRNIYEVEEGLEYRLFEAALKAANFKEFMETVKTKRYTWTRLQRLCVHILTNTNKDEMKMTSLKGSYLRLLGMSKAGREYLNKSKSHINLPIISKLSSYKQDDIKLDIRASRIYSLGVSQHSRNELLIQEFNHPPIYIEKR